MPRTSGVLTLQQLVGAAERLEKKEAHGGVQDDWLSLVEEARDRLADPAFRALPLRAFRVTENGKKRVVASPQNPDRLIQEAIVPLLQAAVEPRMRESSHGYRKGRSTLTAAVRVQHALKSGQRFVTLLDVHNFFPSVDHQRLLQLLEADATPGLAAVVRSFLCASRLLDGQLLPPEGGLPLGLPISPVLSNYYLSDLDDAMEGGDFTFLRFADDLFLAAASRDVCDAAEARASKALGDLGLSLGEEKARRFEYEGEPFLYLGQAVDADRVYERVASPRLERLAERAAGTATAASPTPAAEPEGVATFAPPRTLYVTEHGLFLRIQEGRIVAQRGKEPVCEVPIRKVDRVMVLAGVAMSSGFMTTCISAQIPVVFSVGRSGRVGTLASGSIPNPLRLRAQYDLSADPSRRLALAGAIVAAKCDGMLRRLHRVAGAEQARDSIGALRAGIPRVESVDAMRGVEGAATRAWYSSFRLRIKFPEFAFVARTKRPPKDPLNSLLSFAYTLLYGEMQMSLLAHGLDPHPSFLHELRSGHAALASDMSEPYRILIADSFVLDLVNKRQVTPQDFQKHADGSFWLNSEPRRTVLTAYEGFMGRPLGGRSAATPRRLIEAAVRSLLRVVLGEASELRLPLGATDVAEAEGEC